MTADHKAAAIAEYAVDDSDFVVCESADGVSLHAPGSTDEEIASGDAPYLFSGPALTASAYAEARMELLRRMKAGAERERAEALMAARAGISQED